MKFPRDEYIGLDGLNPWTDHTRVRLVEESEDGCLAVTVMHGDGRPCPTSPRLTAMAKWVRHRLEESGRDMTGYKAGRVDHLGIDSVFHFCKGK